MKKFTENDIFINTIKVYPKVRFFVNDGNVYYNDGGKSGVEIGDFLPEPPAPIISTIPEGAILLESAEPLITEDGDYIIIE